MAKKYGWKDENIIKMNLPRWDKYSNIILQNSNDTNKFKTQSIFLMFTWRFIKKNKNISKIYLNPLYYIFINDKFFFASSFKRI
jgi:hypothetical protein